MSYLDTAINGELSALRHATGSRNDALFRHGARLYQFAAAGAVDIHELTDTLSETARALGLTPQEIKDTLKSAQRAGFREPAYVPSGFRAHLTSVRPVEPPDPCEPPSAAWQSAAGAFLEWCQSALWGTDTTGLDTLEVRGLNALTVSNAGLGYNPQHLTRSRAKWGLEPDQDHGDMLYLPAGIVIPYIIGRQIYKIEIRTTTGKYTLPGSTNALWGADRVRPGRAAMLVEGVFNALTVKQEAGDLVMCVAIGAATHARRIRWIAALSRASQVLVATDAGAAGESAANYWLTVIGERARRWRPYIDDPNAMHQAGLSVRDWVQAGLNVNGVVNA
jgi:hypothetical protein